jgi:hypothetical protein
MCVYVCVGVVHVCVCVYIYCSSCEKVFFPHYLVQEGKAEGASLKGIFAF